MARRAHHHERPIPAHPYRDTALVYGCMAGVLVVVAALTGGDLLQAALGAAAFFAVATAWTWWKFHRRIKARDAAAVAAAAAPVPAGTANGNGRGTTRG